MTFPIMFKAFSAKESIVQYVGTIFDWLGFAWLTFVYKAISVYFQLQLSTGTELENIQSQFRT